MIIDSEKLLRVLSYFEEPVRLGKVLDILKISIVNKSYASTDSIRISVIQNLKGLIRKRFVVKNDKTYKITSSGLKYLAQCELDNDIRTALLRKILVKT